ncbi:MAG: hypothetical protein K1X55_02235 [Chitinophagales bacterium]|nr:hypothetical protein [Chitinophagales bacterium]
MKQIYLLLVLYSTSTFGQSPSFKLNFSINDLLPVPPIEKSCIGLGFNNVQFPDYNFDETNYCATHTNQYDNPSLVTLNNGIISEMNSEVIYPIIIRFPGGTIGNYYHYGTNKVGNGFDSDETLANGETAFFDCIQQESCLKNNFIANQVFLVKNLCSEYQCNYVANIWQHLCKTYSIPNDPNSSIIYRNVLPTGGTSVQFNTFYNETKNAIQYLIDNGIVVNKIELGNEFYLDKYEIKGNVGRLQSLKTIMQEYITRLKMDFPGIKIGVPFSNKSSTQHLDYNLTLRLLQNFDANIFHPYTESKTISGSCVLTNVGCGTDNICSRDYYAAYFSETHCTQIESFKDYLSGNNWDNGKEFWFTEWNSGEDAVRKSIVHGDYIYRFFFDIINASSPILNRITLHNYNSLYSINNNTQGWTLMTYNPSNQTYNKSLPFFIFKYISECSGQPINFNWNLWNGVNSTYFEELNFTGLTPKNFFIKPFFIKRSKPVFGDTKLNHLYVYYSNISSKTINFDYINSSLPNHNPSNVLIINKYLKTSNESIQSDFYAETQNNLLQIKPWSVGLLHVSW